ncbi:UDP-glucose 4-epimerase GalE [Aestuariivirga sp.]|uniref:UDP-glucose 4-epimerase GalE n=1 Tax=Aestuariivirga sp. TaxID=2650926 RepID=UPI00391D3AEC
MQMGRFLVTGGAGYIGSHTAKMLAREGHEVAVCDNLSRGHRDLVKWGPLIEADIRDTRLLREAMRWFRPDAVIHFAAFAYVGESVANPHMYYENNVGGTLSILKAMTEAGVGNIVVSSTCATYGEPRSVPIPEETPQNPINPYGQSKLMMERICQDFDRAHGLRHVALRYFNACGADPEGETGERHDPEPHLIPRALMAASGEIEALDVFGDDYPTPDGTCIRDYIHVNDLARAHLAGALHLLDGGASEAVNLGTGRGASVRDIIVAAERVTGRSVPCRVSPRRLGDPAELVAAAGKARRLLNWQAGNSDLEQIISSAWKWHQQERGRQALSGSA